jgi:hypothetical protein
MLDHVLLEHPINSLATYVPHHPSRFPDVSGRQTKHIAKTTENQNRASSNIPRTTTTEKSLKAKTARIL